MRKSKKTNQKKEQVAFDIRLLLDFILAYGIKTKDMPPFSVGIAYYSTQGGGMIAHRYDILKNPTPTDILILAHEIGHHLDMQSGNKRRLKMAVKAFNISIAHGRDSFHLPEWVKSDIVKSEEEASRLGAMVLSDLGIKTDRAFATKCYTRNIKGYLREFYVLKKPSDLCDLKL